MKLDKIPGHHHHLKWLLNREEEEEKKEKNNQKIKRLGKFLHSYILTQIWSILWCIIENHPKDSDEAISCLFKEKKKNRQLWFLPYYEKKNT